MGIKVRGVRQVISNLNREVRQIETRSKAGLFNVARLVRHSTETKYPRVPVDTGTLRNSWVQVIIPSNFSSSIKLRFGYNANYAFYIHEKVGGDFDAGVNWKRPGSGPKWFQVALNRERDAMVEELAKAAAI